MRYQTGEFGFCVICSMQIESGTECDIKRGNGFFVLSTAFNLKLDTIWNIRQGVESFLLSASCKLKLELCAISDSGKGVLCCQQHAN
jgi:hypothetical protein